MTERKTASLKIGKVITLDFEGSACFVPRFGSWDCSVKPSFRVTSAMKRHAESARALIPGTLELLELRKMILTMSFRLQSHILQPGETVRVEMDLMDEKNVDSCIEVLHSNRRSLRYSGKEPSPI